MNVVKTDCAGIRQTAVRSDSACCFAMAFRVPIVNYPALAPFPGPRPVIEAVVVDLQVSRRAP